MPRRTICGRRRARSEDHRSVAHWLCTTNSDAESPSQAWTGTLFVSSGLSFAGYTDGGNKEIVDGLLSAGDTGHFDETGLWFVDGRDDDMIVSGGENVFPLEVENLLADHPGS